MSKLVKVVLICTIVGAISMLIAPIEVIGASGEECVPEGREVVDVETGKTYFYQVPTLIGQDSCGNPVPDICVQWPDGHYSRLWSAMDCTPAPANAPVTPAPVTELPETGLNTNTVVLAGLLVLVGAGLYYTHRKK